MFPYKLNSEFEAIILNIVFTNLYSEFWVSNQIHVFTLLNFMANSHATSKSLAMMANSHNLLLSRHLRELK